MSNDIQLKPIREEGASPRGYHFIDAWRSCKRAWAFKYLLGLEVEVTPAPLAIGKAIHAWQEMYFQKFFLESKTIAEILEDKSMENIIEDGITRESFFEEAEWLKTKASVKELCALWAKLTYDDFNSYRPLFVEEELTLPLHVSTRGGDLEIELTGRVDRLFGKLSDELLLLDTKSTGNKTSDYVYKTNMAQDQFVMYSALVERRLGHLPLVAIDVCGYNPVRCARTEEFCFTHEDIADFLEGLSGSWSDLIQSMELWEEEKLNTMSKTSLESTFHELFPRTTGRCAYFGCEYSDFCRGVRDLDIPRPGFKQYAPLSLVDIFTHNTPKEEDKHD